MTLGDVVPGNALFMKFAGVDILQFPPLCCSVLSKTERSPKENTSEDPSPPVPLFVVELVAAVGAKEASEGDGLSRPKESRSCRWDSTLLSRFSNVST